MYEELIKALEGCVDCFACTECPIHGSCNGTFDCAAHIAADHIKEQAAEIVSLTAQLAEYQEIGTPFGIKTVLAKKDAQLAAKDTEIERLTRENYRNSTRADRKTVCVESLRDERDQYKADLARVTAENASLRNELCQQCGKYRMVHKGACDRCRWRTPAKQDEEGVEMDCWEKMRDCECGVIDTSPCVKEPYCMIYGEDWSCEDCDATDAEKHKAALMAEEG